MFSAEIVIYSKYYSLRIANYNIACTNTQELYYEGKLHTYYTMSLKFFKFTRIFLMCHSKRV